MEQPTQKVLYNIVRGVNPGQILRNTRLNAVELRKHILYLLELKLISVHKTDNRTTYILSEEGKVQYPQRLNTDMNSKLDFEIKMKQYI